MRPEVKKYLVDMLEAAADIAEFVQGKNFEQFSKDKQLRMAVERAFEILGEALSQTRKLDPALAESIKDWKAIIGFRNVLIHGYGQIDHAKTWDVVQSELPALVRRLRELLNDPPTEHH